MNMKKALPFVFNVLVILPLVLFVQPSSSSRLHHGTNMVESKAMATTTEVERFGNNEGGGSFVRTFEDSARKVPTGPDPLHHNNNPMLRP